MMAVGTGAFGAHGLETNYLKNTCLFGKSDNVSNVSWSRTINYWSN